MVRKGEGTPKTPVPDALPKLEGNKVWAAAANTGETVISGQIPDDGLSWRPGTPEDKAQEPQDGP